MKIHGFQKTTLLDYPGHVAATVFTGGCNFRCPFCQNGSLVLEPESQPLIPEKEVLAHLKKRQGILEGVCITGGEPTLENNLQEFVLKCRELGYLVKLDTNGYRPEMLRKFLQEKILDYVAMDIKASPENYGRATGCPKFDMERIRESIRLIQTSGVSCEFRTTAVKGIHTVQEFEEIGKLLAGSKAYYIQAYRDSGDILGAKSDFFRVERSIQKSESDARGMNSAIQWARKKDLRTEGDAILGSMKVFSKEEMEQMAALAGKYIDKVVLRGVE